MTPQFSDSTLETMIISLINARDITGSHVRLNFNDVFNDEVVKQIKERFPSTNDIAPLRGV